MPQHNNNNINNVHFGQIEQKMEEELAQQRSRPNQPVNAKMPASPYKGTAYRSIAFGTWHIGDASRHFEERKRGRSSGTTEERRKGEEKLQNQRNKMEMEGMECQQQQLGESDSPSSILASSSKAVAFSPKNCHSVMSHSLGDIRHHQCLGVATKDSDLYSASQYVKHCTTTPQTTTTTIANEDVQDKEGSKMANGEKSNFDNAENVSVAASLPPLLLASGGGACCSSSNRSLETLQHLVSAPSVAGSAASSSLHHLHLHHNHPHHSLGCCSSPVPSRISCPPTRRHHPHFAFIVDPLKANRSRHGGGRGGGGGMRNRTKSLDNGLKMNGADRGRRRNPNENQRRGGGGGEDPNGQFGIGTTPTQLRRPIGLAYGGGGSQCSSPIGMASTQHHSSRLELAKQFLRRFYASSTMRLTKKMQPRKEEEGAKTPTTTTRTRMMPRATKVTAQMEQQMGRGAEAAAEGALMYSSAMGPFFEFRRPCAEELPLLPYNIHYAVDSLSECSDSEEDDEEEEEEENFSCYPAPSTAENGGGERRVTNGGGGGKSLLPLLPSSSEAKTSGEMANGGGGSANPNDQSTTTTTIAQRISSPTTMTAATFSSSSSSSSSSSASSPSSASSSSSSSGLMLPAGDLTIPDLSEMQQKFMNCVDSPDSALGGSPSSAGSSNGQTPRMAIQRPTIIAAKRGGPQQQQQQHQMPIGIGMEAERRFANWNELFQYLRREIVEMNVRDAQILHNLETIQAELNGVRQMQQQQGGGGGGGMMTGNNEGRRRRR